MAAIDFDVKLVALTTQVEPDVFNCGDSFDVKLTMKPKNSTFSHKGIMFEFTSELTTEKGKVISLATPTQLQISEGGTLNGITTLQLPQLTIPQNVQTYHGELFSIKHMLKFTVKKAFGNVEYQHEVIAYAFQPPSTKYQPLCVRVAVAENIRIDLVINRRKFELKDVLHGGAHFLLVVLKITKIEVALVAQEVLEIGGKPQKHKNTIFTWEITDGAPVKGEIIPFRLFFAPLDLSPSMVDSSRGYSVSHFLHFMIYTTSGQKYFKALQIKISKWSSMPFEFTD